MELTVVNYSFESMIEELRSVLEAQAGKTGIMLSMEIDEDIPPYLQGDRVKLQEILINLVNNGLKYTKQGQVIPVLYSSCKGFCQRHSPSRSQIIRNSMYRFE